MKAIDPETGYKLCKRGHVKSPENLYGRACKICTKARALINYQLQGKAYRQTVEYKIKMSAYRKTQAAKLTQEKYRKSPKGNEAARKKYQEHGLTTSQKLRNKSLQTAKISTLSDGYIINCLGLKRNEVISELVEIKRLTLKLHRSLICQTKPKHNSQSQENSATH